MGTDLGSKIELKGQRFGRLVAVSVARNEDGKRAWKCRCDCGNYAVHIASRLRRGMVRSCGCLRKETSGQSCITHGASKTAEYQRWLNMKRRCDTPTSIGYKNYGGRGIKVCKMWEASFEAFLADMGPLPSPDHTIERRDVNGNYEPKNCFWLPSRMQQNNRRTTRWIKFHGKKMSLADAIRASGTAQKYSTIHARISLQDMTFEQAIM